MRCQQKEHLKRIQKRNYSISTPIPRSIEFTEEDEDQEEAKPYKISYYDDTLYKTA